MKQLTVLLFSLLLFACNEKQDKVEILEVGVAFQSITPDKGAFIAGDKINRRFTGVHDSLYVKAMVLSDPGNAMAILTFDCIGLLHPALVEIRKEVSQKISVAEFDPSNIVMASTHTHSGPDVVGIWGPDQMTSGVDTAYLKELIHASSEAILSAWENRQAAVAVYAETQFGEEWVYNISDSLNIDRSLTVLQFLNQGGGSIATLSNFACHPTIMDGVSTEVSADFVSSMYSYLDHTLGGVNFFLQGAIGGWIQPEYESKTFESVDRRGRELGQAIETALQNSTGLDSLSIHYRSKIFNMPVSNENFQMLANLGVIDRTITDSVTTEIAWFSIGNAQFVTHPGETTPTHALMSKELMTLQGPRFVIGFGMDAMGYMLTPDYYEQDPGVKHAEYLTRMSVDPNAGDVLMEKIYSLATEN